MFFAASAISAVNGFWFFALLYCNGDRQILGFCLETALCPNLGVNPLDRFAHSRSQKAQRELLIFLLFFAFSAFNAFRFIVERIN